MRTKIGFALMACVLALPVVAQAAIVNGGFETGNLSGWTPIGAASAKTSSIGVTPTVGTYQGDLTTSGNFSAPVASVIASLGVPGPAILGLGAGSPTNGTGLSQSVTVAAGDVLSFDWNFISDELNEGPVYNDFAFFTISGSAYLLASRNSSTWFPSASIPGFDGETGWFTQNYTFTSAGTYTVGFGALNVGDFGHDSALLLDGISIFVPEPALMTLVPLAATLLLRRRK